MRSRDLQKLRDAGFTIYKCSWDTVKKVGQIHIQDSNTPTWKPLCVDLSKVALNREIMNYLSGRITICVQYV